MVWPTVTYCAQPGCGRLRTEHVIRGNGQRGGTDNGSCPGWLPGEPVERPPVTELHRRLAAIAALHHQIDHPYGPACDACIGSDEEPLPYPCLTVAIARGLDPSGAAAREHGRGVAG